MRDGGAPRGVRPASLARAGAVPFRVARLGMVPYAEATALQEALVAARIRDEIADTLLLLEHPPVITLGAGASEADVLAPAGDLARRGIEVVRSRRGGNVTYHGPGQVVAYPIFRIFGPPRTPPGGLRPWIDTLVGAVVDTLAAFGIDGAPDSPLPGVRVDGAGRAGGSKKIAFFGLRISRGVAWHGLALNVDPDLSPFDLIVPCGRPGDAVTSMEEVLGVAPRPDDVEATLVRALAGRLRRPFEAVPPADIWRLAPARSLPRRREPDRAGPKPVWLRAQVPGGPVFAALQATLRSRGLHTVCEEAHCPNLGECWGRGTATFMILGRVCTRACGFCAVETGRPSWMGAPDLDEPRRVADAVAAAGLRYAVVTSVNRDDLADGGASVWAATIRAIRDRAPGVGVEVLIPDLMGSRRALQTILDAAPDVLNHNLETVPRLYPTVRPRARYDRSLELLCRARAAGLRTKTGIMLGLGERPDEVAAVLEDVAEAGVSIVTLGQYLRPTPAHLPVDRWVHPEEFAHWRSLGESLGIDRVEAGPLVRSSYHAEEAALVGASRRDAGI